MIAMKHCLSSQLSARQLQKFGSSRCNKRLQRERNEDTRAHVDRVVRQVYMRLIQLPAMGKDNSMKEYVTEYMTFRWSSPENLIEQLNLLVNQGWREHL